MSIVSDRKYECPICGKVFTKPHTVKVHMRLHTGQRPHECHLCSKSFVTSSALKDHLISHVTRRNFKCNKCGGKFKHKGTLKRHQSQHEEYERKRDLNESSETSVVYKSQSPFKPDHYTICVEDALKKFPHLQAVLSQKSSELSTHEIIANDSAHPTIVKQERLIQKNEDLHNATIFELTDDIYNEKLNVKIYSISEKVQEFAPNICSSLALHENPQKSSEKVSTVPLSEKKLSSANVFILPRISISQEAAVLEMPVTDVAARYGFYISRILRLLDSQDKQAALIKRLNQTLHNFIVKRRK